MRIKIVENIGNINQVIERVANYTIADFDIGVGKIPLSIIQAANDIIIGTGIGQVSVLPVGPAGSFLGVDENGELTYISIEGGSENFTVCNGRLTLVSNTPLTTTDQTSKTTVYFTPYFGNLIGLYYDGAWSRYVLTECLIKLTDTQNGTITNGSNIVTGLSNTSQLIVGMEVSGTGISGGTTIASIVSGSQITLSANATDTGEKSLTFKVPASTVLDIFAYWTGTAVKLEMVKWTNTTTRANALTTDNGILVKTGDNTKRYIGGVATTATAGQTEDSIANRLVWNAYNRMRRYFEIKDTTDSWAYTTTAWRSLNNNNANRINFVVGLNESIVEMQGITTVSGGTGYIGFGLDKINGNDTVIRSIGSSFIPSQAIYSAYPGIGLHYLQMVEYGGSGAVFYGDQGGIYQCGAVGWMEA